MPSPWTSRLLSHVARVACRLTSGTSSLDGSADPGRPRTLLSVLMRTLSLETTRDVGSRHEATHEATVRSASVPE